MITVTPVSLVALTEEELRNEQYNHFSSSSDDRRPSANTELFATNGTIQGVDPVYLTVCVFTQIAWESAEGGYPITTPVEKEAYRVSGVASADAYHYMFEVLKTDYLERHICIDDNDVVVIATAIKPYAHTPYFGYC